MDYSSFPNPRPIKVVKDPKVTAEYSNGTNFQVIAISANYASIQHQRVIPLPMAIVSYVLSDGVHVMHVQREGFKRTMRKPCYETALHNKIVSAILTTPFF